MPTPETDPLQQLPLGNEDVDETINLHGLSPEEALSQLTHLIAATPGGRRILLRFSPASGDGGETLFQPLGRALLAARRAGRLSSCLPTRDACGYLIVTNVR